MSEEQRADARLAPLSAIPFNAETRLNRHVGVITPTAAFYARNHFAVPRIDANVWRLVIDSEVDHPLALSYAAVLAFPQRTLLATLECAGNGRASMRPTPLGEPWQLGAVSTAEWTGTPLAHVLAAAGVRPTACEIMVEGSDSGYAQEARADIPFARSLPTAQALHPDTLLAYAMNGEALSPEHGFPLRLIVPGWYGMAAVKWVTHIAAVATPFAGFYQKDRYIMRHAEDPESLDVPLTVMPVRSVFTSPNEGATLPLDTTHVLRGLAWSGAAPVARIEVSVDAGLRWQNAEFTSDYGPYAWRTWDYRWQAETVGPVILQCRATDGLGNVQPVTAEWNALGYANNSIQSLHAQVI